jgi:hypothetical protein
MSRRVFPARVARLVSETRYLGLRAGENDHRFTGIWGVVVQGRVFVRPWNNRRSGWRQAFEEDPRGTLQAGERRLRVRARAVRGERLLDAIDAAYAAKYDTAASLKWVRGFRHPRRRATTVELLPR